MEVTKRVILDSTILIGVLRNKREEAELIRELEAKTKLATTTINAFEVYYGAYKSKDVQRNLASVKGLLSTLELLTVDEGSAETAGQVLAELESEGQSIDVRDLFIGCVAVSNGFTVLTHNKQHFQRIPKLHVVTPSEIKSSKHL
ncbi:MAG: type II toxin-antitoxin system VapC family toxin [Candidatus Bathyarchaeota archaeon]|nr:type II toxin-antitoxin system VapC family toxin [Candidatus Bathyarchaeota archaeon]MDH5755015.1 type II toxin-antitoxin system VapC family toxin [Candidatus Bathyarchaeota archaeon]